MKFDTPTKYAVRGSRVLCSSGDSQHRRRMHEGIVEHARFEQSAKRTFETRAVRTRIVANSNFMRFTFLLTAAGAVLLVALV